MGGVVRDGHARFARWGRSQAPAAVGRGAAPDEGRGGGDPRDGKRSQTRNREAVRARLAAMMWEALVSPVPWVATAVPKGERVRRVKVKRRRGR